MNTRQQSLNRKVKDGENQSAREGGHGEVKREIHTESATIADSIGFGSFISCDEDCTRGRERGERMRLRNFDIERERPNWQRAQGAVG